MARGPLRVAVLARAVMPLHGVGGLERSVHDLVRHLAARAVEVTLIVPPPAPVRHDSRADPFASPHIRLRHVPYVTFPFANRRGTTILDRSTGYLLYGWRAGRLARALAASGRIDIVHCHGASGLGCVTGPGCPVPVVLNPHGMEEFGATAAAMPPLKRAAYGPLRWAVRRIAARADCVVATDRSLEPVVARHLRPADGAIRVIPNGIDLLATSALAGTADGLLLRRAHGIAPGETVLLTVGRLEHNKGLDVLAAALADAGRAGTALAAAGWRWVIVGAGPYRQAIAHLVTATGLESHVLFVGRAPDRDVHAWYEAASLFIQPSRYEGSSITTLEAMAHRRPIIATRAGGLPDKVFPGVNGWLAEAADPVTLSAAITDAVSDPARLAAMGQRSREIVEREFAWSVLVDQQIAVYEALIEARSSGYKPAR
jgi:glycosyltransferase involved in cell wall biosynthesis